MSQKDLQTVLGVSSNSSNYSCKASMNSRYQFSDGVYDAELIHSDSQMKLTNSWVSVDDSKSLTKNASEVTKVSTGFSQGKNDSLQADPLKLGYVVPVNKSIYTSPYNQNFDSALDSEDASLVFVSKNEDIETKNEVLVVDELGPRLSSSLDLHKVYSPFSSSNSSDDFCASNTTESFCDLVSDTYGIDSVLENNSIQSTRTLNSSSDSQLFDNALIYKSSKMSAIGRNTPLYPSLKPFSCEHPEHFGEQDYNGVTGKSNANIFQSIQPVQGNQINDSIESFPYSLCEGVPTPPPELGLPDLTKKIFFPLSPSDDQSGSAGSFGEGTDASAVVRNKVMGLWNNVKYGWSVNLGTNFSKSAPIVLLGHIYRPSSGLLPDACHGLNSCSHNSMTAFRDAFHSLTWFTYRTKLPPLNVGPSPTKQASSGGASKQRSSDMQGGGPTTSSTAVDLTSDCGWGCTLRCTQMMFCHALHRHFLGDEWVYTPGVPSVGMQVHCRLVRWFGDGPGRGGESPLSLHRLTACGYERHGKQPGDWYTPSNAASTIRDAVEAGSKYMPDLQRISVYTSINNVIYIQDILDQCWTPCICKMGKIAEYVKQQQQRYQSKKGLACDGSSVLYGRRVPSSDDGLDTMAADTLSSYVQVESLPCDINQSGHLHIKPNIKEARSNNDLSSGVNTRSKLFLGRSLSVDEAENFHIVNKNSKMTDLVPSSEGGSNQLTDSFIKVDDVPFNSTLLSSHPKNASYSKSSFSQKLFGSYNPFKLPTKSSYPGLSTKNKSGGGSAAVQYCTPVKCSSKRVLARRDSLDSGTLSLVSPILEQERLCSDCHSWRSLVLIIAVRMGGDCFNTIYETVLETLLRHPLCIGLVGGRAKRAFYFVGYQDDQLLYLDPHTSQEAVPCSWSFPPDVGPYHCDTPRKMPLTRLEPSATLGFYCHTRTEFVDLVVDLPKLTTVREGRLSYPLVEVKLGSRQQQENLWNGGACELTDLDNMLSDLEKRGQLYGDISLGLQGGLTSSQLSSSGRQAGASPNQEKQQIGTGSRPSLHRNSSGKLDDFTLVE